MTVPIGSQLLILRKLQITLDMITFEHTIFALPFAFIGALLARKGLPTGWQLTWIIGAMVGARSAAMTFNRIADLRYDKSRSEEHTSELQSQFHLVCRLLLEKKKNKKKKKINKKKKNKQQQKQQNRIICR